MSSMLRFRALCLGAALATLPLVGGVAPSSDLAAQEAAEQETYAFEDVRVVSMDDESIHSGRTVVVRDGEIVEVGPSTSVEVPDGAVRISGEGRYLAPGLTDMHGRLPAADDPMLYVVLEEILFMYLANGVTTVRLLDGAPYQLELVEQIAAGDELGPTFHVGSPVFDGATPDDSDAVSELVRSHADAGYDLLTVGTGLSNEAWGRMVEAAEEAGIPFGGRLPTDVGLELALDAGTSTVDHLDGYLEATRQDGLSGDASPEERFRATDPLKLESVAQRTAEAGVYPVPAQYLSHHLFGWNEHLGGRVEADSVRTLPEFGYVPDSQRDGWVTEAWNRWAGPEITEESARAYAEWRRELLAALHDADAPVLLGTHSPALFNVPGFSIHRELPLMVEAGMTPYEALRSGTRVAARYAREELGRSESFGAVASGHRADLLLLDENPLETVGALANPTGVMVRGIWLSPEAIDERMAEIAERYGEFEVD